MWKVLGGGNHVIQSHTELDAACSWTERSGAQRMVNSRARVEMENNEQTSSLASLQHSSRWSGRKQPTEPTAALYYRYTGIGIPMNGSS